jgi:hypothetical protein
MAISVADKLEIHETLANLYSELDSHRPEGWAECFAPDGVFDGNKYGEFKGRAAIAGFIRSHIEKGNEDASRHCLTNIRVEEAPGGAIVRTYVAKFRVDSRPGVFVAAADLKAKMNKAQGRWQIERLELMAPEILLGPDSKGRSSA